MPEKNYYSLSMNVMISSIVVLLLFQLILSHNTANIHSSLSHILMNQFIIIVFTTNILSIVFVTSSLYYYSRYGSLMISKVQQVFTQSLEVYDERSVKGKMIKWFLSNGNSDFDLYQWTKNNTEKFAILLIALIFAFNNIKYLVMLNPNYSIELMLRSMAMPHTLLEMVVYYFVIIAAIKFSNNPIKILKTLIIAIALLFIAAMTEAYLTPIVFNTFTHI